MIIFNPAALGDVLLSTPFLRQLKKSTNEKIKYIISDYSKVILNKNPYVDEIETVGINDFKNPIFLFKFFLKYFSFSKETVFVLRKHWFFIFLWRVIRPFGKIIGFNKYSFPLPASTVKYPKKIFKKHEIFYYLDLLNFISVKPDYTDWKMDFFDLKEFDLSKYKIKKPYCVLVPGSGNPGDKRAKLRRWPIEVFINYSKKCKNAVFLGSKNEKIFEEKIKKSSNAVCLFGKTSIGEAAYILKNADKVITNDTGLMHLASVFNNNILSLFTLTSPIRLAPLNKGAKYILKKGRKPEEDLYNL